MAVLTNFLPVQELEKERLAKQEKYVSELKKFRKVIASMYNTFDCCIPEDSSVGREIITKESEVFQSFWNEVGFIPSDFSISCLNTKRMYNYLCTLSQYPVVKISELKKIADILSFVILPISYININKIIETYSKKDKHYAMKIEDSYDDFQEVVFNCQRYTGKQRLYILAPVSFYNTWAEVTSKEILPKYFSRNLEHLSTTLGIMIPTQRNLYKMIKTNQKDISNLQETMQENFKAVEKSITECHKRIDWVESLVKDLENKVKSSESRIDRMNMNLHLLDIQTKNLYLDHHLYSVLDPIIFSVDANTNISDVACNNENARIGLCFGADMPIDFFVEKGMTTINDKRLESVTHILKL